MTCLELEELEAEEEAKARARKNVDPRDCTWSGMVQDTSRDESRPRYQVNEKSGPKILKNRLQQEHYKIKKAI